MKFCKTCDKKLPKDKKLDQCFDCIYKEEKEKFDCDFDGDEYLTCTYQKNMFRRGYVMDCEGNWLSPEEAKEYPRPEELQDYVDWIHLHCSGDCVKYYKYCEPEKYKKTCKHFGVKE